MRPITDATKFIASLPIETPYKEVIAMGAKKGLTLSVGQIYKARERLTRPRSQKPKHLATPALNSNGITDFTRALLALPSPAIFEAAIDAGIHTSLNAVGATRAKLRSSGHTPPNQPPMGTQEFIRSQPPTLTTKQVVEAAHAAGLLDVTPTAVYYTRWAMKNARVSPMPPIPATAPPPDLRFPDMPSKPKLEPPHSPTQTIEQPQPTLTIRPPEPTPMLTEPIEQEPGDFSKDSAGRQRTAQAIFVLKQPADMPWDKVQELAKKSGMKLSREEIWRLRWSHTHPPRAGHAQLTESGALIEQYPIDTDPETLRKALQDAGLLATHKSVAVLLTKRREREAKLRMKPREKTGATSFVESLPHDMPIDEVLKQAKLSGLRKITRKSVHRVRHKMRVKMKTAKTVPRRKESTPPVAPDVARFKSVQQQVVSSVVAPATVVLAPPSVQPPPHGALDTAEVRFREALMAIGLVRAQQIVHEVESAFRGVLGGPKQ